MKFDSWQFSTILIFMLLFVSGVFLRQSLDYDIIIAEGWEQILKTISICLSFILPFLFIRLTWKEDINKVKSSNSKAKFDLKRIFQYLFIYIATFILSNAFGFIILHSFADYITINKLNQHTDEKTILSSKLTFNNHGTKYELSVTPSFMKRNLKFYVKEDEFEKVNIDDTITIRYHTNKDGSICIKQYGVLK